jgi:iron(III) transport system permease protein
VEVEGSLKSAFNSILHKAPGFLLILPPLLLVAGFLLIPVLHLFVKGLGSVAPAHEALPDYLWPHLLSVTGNTFLLGFLTTTGALAIALPLAFLLVRTDLFASRVWLSILTIPLITPPFIMAFAVLSLYGRSGIVSILLQHVGIYPPHIFGLPGLVIMQLTVSVPYATFIIAAGLQGVPRHIDETAASLGVDVLRIWRDLTLPCIYPHIIISGLMIFLMSIGDVGGPLVIGGGFTVLASEIYTSFLSLLNDERIALIFSLWIILLSFLLLASVNWLLRLTVKQYRPGINPVIYRLSRFRLPASILVSCTILLLLLPFIMILIQSFVTIWSFELLPRGLTFEHYHQILQPPSLLTDTLGMALIATPFIILAGLILGHSMYSRKRLRFLNFIMIIPFVLPGVVLAVGVLGTYAGLFPAERAIPFFFLLLFTIIIRRLPYSLKTLEAGFLVSDHRREEVARSLGSSQFGSFLNVTLPQMKTFVVAAFIIGLIKTATELSASLILAPPDWRSLPLGIIFFIDQGQLSRASALSVLLIAVIGTGTFFTAFWSQGSRRTVQTDSSEALERLILGRAPISFHSPPGKRQRITRPALRPHEPLLVVVDRFGITEANPSFLRLAGADTLKQLQAETSFSVLFFGDPQVLEIFTSLESIENRATSMMILDGSRVPVILNAYILVSSDGTKRAYFYCRRVSGRANRVREYRRLRERMSAAEQTALKAQITPHFLFNSLNSVIQLIDTDPSEARDVVQNLADLYRYILTSTKSSFVTVGEEIASIQHYLAVEKARFGNKLFYEINASPVILSTRVPPMLLQPLVENAVNHGMKNTGEIYVSIDVFRVRDDLVLRITDQGDSVFDPAEAATGTGTGLKNVEGRLFALYHRRISYEARKGGGLIVTIAIPKENE